MIYNVKVYRGSKYVTSEYFNTYDESLAFAETQSYCYGFYCRVYMYDSYAGKFILRFKSVPNECL